MLIKSFKTVKPMDTVSAPLSVPLLRFPRLYIIAIDVHDPGQKRFVFSLETVPGEVFHEWLKTVLHECAVRDECAIKTIQGLGTSWGTKERWQAINALAESSVDMSRYLYDDREKALLSLKAQKSIHAIVASSDDTKDDKEASEDVRE